MKHGALDGFADSWVIQVPMHRGKLVDYFIQSQPFPIKLSRSSCHTNMEGIQPSFGAFLNLWLRKPFSISFLSHNILTVSHFHTELCMYLLQPNMHLIGIDDWRMLVVVSPLLKDHPGIHSCNSKESGALRSIRNTIISHQLRQRSPLYPIIRLMAC